MSMIIDDLFIFKMETQTIEVLPLKTPYVKKKEKTNNFYFQ